MLMCNGKLCNYVLYRGRDLLTAHLLIYLFIFSSNLYYVPRIVLGTGDLMIRRNRLAHYLVGENNMRITRTDCVTHELHALKARDRFPNTQQRKLCPLADGGPGRFGEGCPQEVAFELPSD